MYQSVMAKRQGTGSSGTGFAFVLATIKEINAAQNICLAQDLQSGDQYQVGLTKRGILAWPQVGDTWILDRSMGHWSLRTKITDTAPPSVTGSRKTMTPTTQALLSILDDLGLLADQTTTDTTAVDVWQTPTLLNGFTSYASSGDDVTVRYKMNYDNTVTVEGRVTPPGTVANGVTMFNIAAPYRPPVIKYQTTIVANGIAGTILYNKNGDVGIFDFGSNTVIRVLFHMRYSLV